MMDKRGLGNNSINFSKVLDSFQNALMKMKWKISLVAWIANWQQLNLQKDQKY